METTNIIDSSIDINILKKSPSSHFTKNNNKNILKNNIDFLLPVLQ
jgi:hypothetical protein